MEGRRYWKFNWSDLGALPSIGRNDYHPKGRAFRKYEEGTFQGEYLEAFPVVKSRRKLRPFGVCVFCGCDKDQDGKQLVLTSEHVIPEYLGAGLELPDATCSDCQKVTAQFESSIATEMFDPIRASFGLSGKEGLLEKTNFPVDIGKEISQHQFIRSIYHPTILVLPALYPASSYSRRPKDADDLFNFRMHNINADAGALAKYAIDTFSTQSVDLVRFSQMIAKIAHVYATHYFGTGRFRSAVASFIRTNYAPGATATGYLEHVGSLWNPTEQVSTNLHEIEVGMLDWCGHRMHAARVRLFASCGMPSYFVTVGVQ